MNKALIQRDLRKYLGIKSLPKIIVNEASEPPSSPTMFTCNGETLVSVTQTKIVFITFVFMNNHGKVIDKDWTMVQQGCSRWMAENQISQFTVKSFSYYLSVQFIPSELFIHKYGDKNPNIYEIPGCTWE